MNTSNRSRLGDEAWSEAITIIEATTEAAATSEAERARESVAMDGAKIKAMTTRGPSATTSQDNGS